MLKYYLNGGKTGPATTISYTYNLDNMLTGFNTASGPTFSLSNTSIDGLGRLKNGTENIAGTSHSLSFQYDMLSQLTSANITNIGGNTYQAVYNYYKNGNMASRTINTQTETFGYTGHQMTNANGITLNYDNNGNMKNLPTTKTNRSLTYNWDNKLRITQFDSNSISLRYDPSGNRIRKDSSVLGTRKYIVDVIGDLPVILMELNTSGNILKTYIYGNSQILAQHDGNYSANRYFYLHDRLGSVRQIINTNGNIVNCYTYSPFGETLEIGESITNPWRFTGQYYDSEIDLYYLRARNYHPHTGRFTSRDLITGRFDNPLSLHRYLYCQNEPINRIDPWGLWYAEGHSFLTRSAIKNFEFSSSDIDWISMYNITVDEDYFFDNAHHFFPGYVTDAEGLITQCLEEAIYWEKRGWHEGALAYLGVGLHIVQDKWAHYEQKAGWGKHILFWFGPRPDTPYKHPKEFAQAYKDSQSFLDEYERMLRGEYND